MKISECNVPVAENIERIINEKGLKKAFVACYSRYQGTDHQRCRGRSDHS